MQIRHKFNPFKETGVRVPEENREEALEAAAEYVKEQVLLNTAEGVTSVQGGRWRKKLTKDYAEEKDGPDFANLENTGELMDGFKTGVEGESIVLEVDPDQEGKAEGNLKGTYGKSSPIKGGKYAREFMPYKRGMKLSREIIRGVKEILEEYEE